MTVEGQPDKMVSDIEVCMKQRRVTEFLHEEKFTPRDYSFVEVNRKHNLGIYLK